MRKEGSFELNDYNGQKKASFMSAATATKYIWDLSPASLEAEIADTEESGEVDCYTWELFNIFVELSQNV